MEKQQEQLTKCNGNQPNQEQTKTAFVSFCCRPRVGGSLDKTEEPEQLLLLRDNALSPVALIAAVWTGRCWPRSSTAMDEMEVEA